jgi:hypothetical protein
MRALDQAVEAECLGAARQRQIVGQPRPHVLARQMLAAHDQAQFHACSSRHCVVFSAKAGTQGERQVVALGPRLRRGDDFLWMQPASSGLL